MSTVPLLAQLPAAYLTIPYVAARVPGSTTDLGKGANCQRYAYAVLRHFGLAVPPLRSSDLWADAEATVRVAVAQPLDLMLFNANDVAWGAHVGVCVGADEVLHLCAEVGKPAVWSMRDFAARPRYRCLIGSKRVPREANP